MKHLRGGGQAIKVWELLVYVVNMREPQWFDNYCNIYNGTLFRVA
jgi:hypothetical protein